MKTLNLLVLACILSLSVIAKADDEDLAPQNSVSLRDQDTSVFDETRIHLGISLVDSMQDYLIAPGVREKGTLRGFELGLGVDLFSPEWIAEGIISTFPQDSISDTNLSLSGFELRLLYEKPIFYGVTLHGGVGLGSRAYNLKTKPRADHTVAALDKSFNSGASVLVFGADYWPSGEVSAGLEVTNHLPMAAGDDPSSIDFAVKLTGHF